MTLIELSVVMAIISIISAAGILTMRGPVNLAKQELSLEQMISLDRRARDRGIFCRLRFSISADSAELRGKQGGLIGMPVTFSGGLQFRQVFGVGKTLDNRIAIDVSSLGTSPSYAIEFSRPSSPSPDLLWLLFLGTTGQSYVTRDFSMVAEALQL